MISSADLAMTLVAAAYSQSLAASLGPFSTAISEELALTAAEGWDDDASLGLLAASRSLDTFLGN